MRIFKKDEVIMYDGKKVKVVQQFDKMLYVKDLTEKNGKTFAINTTTDKISTSMPELVIKGGSISK